MTKTAIMKEILPAFPEENIGKRMSGIKGRVPPDNIHHENPFKQFIGTCFSMFFDYVRRYVCRHQRFAATGGRNKEPEPQLVFLFTVKLFYSISPKVCVCLLA